MSNQFDVSPEARQLEEQRVQRRLFLRNEFLKQKTDPFQHASEAGSVFDSAFLRYQSMQVNSYDYFKPSGKNILRAIAFVVVPMVGLGYLISSSRQKREALFRRGEVAYKDRTHKFA